MYVRTINDRELNFRVSGKLWNRSLVMQDQETGSLWSHILGKCMQGELKDTQLVAIPSVMTTWQDWRQRHPKTDVMLWPQDGYQFDQDYYQKFGMQHFVAGLVLGGKARAYAFDDLAKVNLVNDVHESVPLVIWFDPANGAVYGWRRSLDDQTVLEFRHPGDAVDEGGEADQVVDVATGSKWDLTHGVAIAGPLKDQRLTPIVVIPSFRAAWDEFHPNSSYWKPERP